MQWNLMLEQAQFEPTPAEYLAIILAAIAALAAVSGTAGIAALFGYIVSSGVQNLPSDHSPESVVAHLIVWLALAFLVVQVPMMCLKVGTSIADLIETRLRLPLAGDIAVRAIAGVFVAILMLQVWVGLYLVVVRGALALQRTLSFWTVFEDAGNTLQFGNLIGDVAQYLTWTFPLAIALRILGQALFEARLGAWPRVEDLLSRRWAEPQRTRDLLDRVPRLIRAAVVAITASLLFVGAYTQASQWITVAAVGLVVGWWRAGLVPLPSSWAPFFVAVGWLGKAALVVWVIQPQRVLEVLGVPEANLAESFATGDTFRVVTTSAVVTLVLYAVAFPPRRYLENSAGRAPRRSIGSAAVQLMTLAVGFAVLTARPASADDCGTAGDTCEGVGGSDLVDGGVGSIFPYWPPYPDGLGPTDSLGGPFGPDGPGIDDLPC
jgi:hypothetical protein